MSTEADKVMWRNNQNSKIKYANFMGIADNEMKQTVPDDSRYVHNVLLDLKKVFKNPCFKSRGSPFFII